MTTVTWSSDVIVAGPGWLGWLVLTLVLVGLWAVPIAGITALFRTARSEPRSDDQASAHRG